MKYKSKTDWWLAVIIFGSMLMTIGIGVYALATEVLSLVELFILILLTILFPLGILWMWFTAFYVIDEEYLIIRYGPFKQKISLQSIKSIIKSCVIVKKNGDYLWSIRFCSHFSNEQRSVNERTF
nr:PH domain-containing protein [Massilibacterium senegalense]